MRNRTRGGLLPGCRTHARRRQIDTEGLPIDPKPTDPAPGTARKPPFEGPAPAGSPVGEESTGQPPFRMTALTPKYRRMNQTRAALVMRSSS
jgi:hypothetical protein